MTDRTPLIAGNWKMFKTVDQAVQTARDLVVQVRGVTDTEIMIAPTFTALAPVSAVVAGTNVALGAQNLYWENEGAYTGEISARMLVSAGCRYAIIGHSERRQYFGETDETVNLKVNASIHNNLIPILCIGESDSQRESKETFNVLDKQVKKGLEGFFSDELAALVIAYEPVWAIGTGKTASADQAQEVHRFLRGLLAERFGNSFAKSIRILYGGSVKPDNISGLMEMPDIDGALVGGASLNAETFGQLARYRK